MLNLIIILALFSLNLLGSVALLTVILVLVVKSLVFSLPLQSSELTSAFQGQSSAHRGTPLAKRTVSEFTGSVSDYVNLCNIPGQSVDRYRTLPGQSVEGRRSITPGWGESANGKIEILSPNLISLVFIVNGYLLVFTGSVTPFMRQIASMKARLYYNDLSDLTGLTRLVGQFSERLPIRILSAETSKEIAYIELDPPESQCEPFLGSCYPDFVIS